MERNQEEDSIHINEAMFDKEMVPETGGTGMRELFWS